MGHEISGEIADLAIERLLDHVPRDGIPKVGHCPNLSGYVRDLHEVPGIANTVNFDHTKAITT